MIDALGIRLKALSRLIQKAIVLQVVHTYLEAAAFQLFANFPAHGASALGNEIETGPEPRRLLELHQ